MKRFKVGIIGCGMISKMFHVPVMTHLPEIKIEAFSDVNKGWADELASLYSAPFSFSDYRDMIGRVDLAVVATPNSLHAAISRELIANGIHVLCEKPMGISADECEKVLNSENPKGALFMVAHSRRFASNAMLLRDFHERGFLGEIKSMELMLGHSHTQWVTRSGFSFKKELSGGGALIDQGIHLIDLMVWFCNDNGIEVESVAGKDILGFGMEDYVEAKFLFSNGGSALIKTSRVHEWDNLCRIDGTKGWATFHIDDKSKLQVYSDEIRGCRKAGPLEIKTSLNNIYYDQIKYFINCIQNGMQPMTSGESSIKGIRLLESCYGKMRLGS